MANTDIKRVNASSFATLTMLNILELSYNLIEYIDQTAFLKLTNLIYLELQFNKLVSIQFSISDLCLLTKIDLSCNYLEKIENYTF